MDGWRATVACITELYAFRLDVLHPSSISLASVFDASCMRLEWVLYRSCINVSSISLACVLYRSHNKSCNTCTGPSLACVLCSCIIHQSCMRLLYVLHPSGMRLAFLLTACYTRLACVSHVMLHIEGHRCDCTPIQRHLRF